MTLLAEPGDQLEHPRLDSTSSALVGLSSTSRRGSHGQRSGDRDPLALTARELVGEGSACSAGSPTAARSPDHPTPGAGAADDGDALAALR